MPRSQTLWLGPSLEWISRPTGDRYRLGKTSRLILQALVANHRAGCGAALSGEELLDIGWPGERPLAQAGYRRVLAELNRLRGMGVHDLLAQSEEGYALTPETILREAPVPLLSRLFGGGRHSR